MYPQWAVVFEKNRELVNQCSVHTLKEQLIKDLGRCKDGEESLSSCFSFTN